MAIRVRDDLNRDVVLLAPPLRVVSLVPSDTETLFALGVGDRVVGRTEYCIEPAGEVHGIPTCGGTKDIDIDAIRDLAPQLVFANQEENARVPLERLAATGIPLFVSFPRRVADGIAHVARLARMMGVAREDRAVELVRRGYEALRQAQADASRLVPLPTFLPIWMDPLMTLGGDTFASDLLALAGAGNVFYDRERRYPLAADLGKVEPLPAERVAGRDTRYPRVSLDEVLQRAPELILLPDEPHEFTEDDAVVFRGQATPAARRGAIELCDGKDLFWYGSRTIDALARLRALDDRHRAA